MTTVHHQQERALAYIASNQAQPLLLWWRRDLGLGASKNKRALIGQFKGKIPSRREVPPPEGWRATTPKVAAWRATRRKRHVDPSFVESRLLLCARRFLSPNEKNVFHSFRPGWMRQNAGQKVFTRTPERAYICLPRCWKILPLSCFFFFKKERSIIR